MDIFIFSILVAIIIVYQHYRIRAMADELRVLDKRVNDLGNWALRMDAENGYSPIRTTDLDGNTIGQPGVSETISGWTKP